MQKGKLPYRKTASHKGTVYQLKSLKKRLHTTHCNAWYFFDFATKCVLYIGDCVGISIGVCREIYKCIANWILRECRIIGICSGFIPVDKK